MKTLAGLSLIAALAAASAAPAQAPTRPELELPQKLDRALRDMMQDLKPALDEALELMRSFEVIDDPRHYRMPEVLPNGDIIIRRRQDAPPYRPDAPDEPEAAPESRPGDGEDGVRT